MARIILTQMTDDPEERSDEVFVVETTTLDNTEAYDPTGCAWTLHSMPGLSPELWQSEHGDLARRI